MQNTCLRPRPRRLPLVLVLALVLGAGCGKSAETCQRESADLAAIFQGMDTRLGVETQFVRLARRDDLPVAPDIFGERLEVSEAGFWLAGRDAAPGDVDHVLAQVRERARGRPLPTLLLAIDAQAPWQRVVELFEALQGNAFDSALLVFARTPIVSTPPPRTPFDEELDALEKAAPSDRAERLAKLVSQLIRECQATKDLFASVAPTEDKAKFIMDGLPPALVACRCRTDVPALKSLMYRLLANRAPTTTLRVTFGGAEVAHRGNVPWAEASAAWSQGLALSPRLSER